MASNTRLVVPLGPDGVEGHMMVSVDANGDVFLDDNGDNDYTFNANDWDMMVAYVNQARLNS